MEEEWVCVQRVDGVTAKIRLVSKEGNLRGREPRLIKGHKQLIEAEMRFDPNVVPPNFCTGTLRLVDPGTHEDVYIPATRIPGLSRGKTNKKDRNSGFDESLTMKFGPEHAFKLEMPRINLNVTSGNAHEKFMFMLIFQLHYVEGGQTSTFTVVYHSRLFTIGTKPRASQDAFDDEERSPTNSRTPTPPMDLMAEGGRGAIRTHSRSPVRTEPYPRRTTPSPTRSSREQQLEVDVVRLRQKVVRLEKENADLRLMMISAGVTPPSPLLSPLSSTPSSPKLSQPRSASPLSQSGWNGMETGGVKVLPDGNIAIVQPPFPKLSPSLMYPSPSVSSAHSTPSPQPIDTASYFFSQSTQASTPSTSSHNSNPLVGSMGGLNVGAPGHLSLGTGILSSTGFTIGSQNSMKLDPDFEDSLLAEFTSGVQLTDSQFQAAMSAQQTLPTPNMIEPTFSSSVVANIEEFLASPTHGGMTFSQ